VTQTDDDTAEQIEYAATPAGQLAYTRRGSGEPLILIQGLAGHHGMWGEPFLSALAGRLDVVAFDHRGIGTSTRADEQFTLVDLADDTVAVMDHLGWDSAHVLGISMGGAIAQEVALRHPDRVRRLVLGCTSPGPGDDHGVPVGGPGIGAFGEAVASGDPAVAARIMYAANVSAAFAGEPGHFEEFDQASRSVRVPAPVVMMQVAAAFGHDAIDRLPSLTTPTLVMHGTEDAIMLRSAGEWLASLIPDAKLELVEDAGHLFYWEQPERSAELVTEHLLG
jgi:pimeloyl-ACP methyl ester carboxylesterase